jgi:hypothetical protein
MKNIRTNEFGPIVPIGGRISAETRHHCCMVWLPQTLDYLSARPVCGYSRDSAPASEPTALAALALAAHGRADVAARAADWLARIQAADGSVGVREDQTPGWPTSLAVLAWLATNESASRQTRIDRGIAWILEEHGETMPQPSEFGHNTEIAGWSYADGTSCWLEPTALHVAALKSADRSSHVRTRDGVRLLKDRLLESGGCNYGNTVVLGQTLRPHVQPTGIALIALYGEKDASGRIGRSIEWLRQAIGPQTTTASLAWALLGLSTHGVAMPRSADWLAAAHGRTVEQGNSPHKLALLALAAKGWPR